MKKIVFLIFILFLTSNQLFAIEETTIPQENFEKEIILEPVVLEKEETKVWQYSTQMLYSLFEQEEQTGMIRFPDV